MIIQEAEQLKCSSTLPPPPFLYHTEKNIAQRAPVRTLVSEMQPLVLPMHFPKCGGILFPIATILLIAPTVMSPIWAYHLVKFSLYMAL